MRRAAVAAVAFALCLAGTSCTDDSGGAQPPPTTGPGSSADPPTTSGPGEGPPELPDAAKAKTTAGAKAFVAYYVDVLNYSFQTQTTKALSQLGSRSCKVCSAIVVNLDRTRRRGGSQSGGEWTLNKQFAVPNQPVSRPKLVVNIHVSSGHWHRSASSQLLAIKEQDVSNEFDLLWSGDRWRLGDVKEA